MKKLIIILGLILTTNCFGDELKLTMTTSESNDKLARSDTRFRIFNADLEKDLGGTTYGILGISVGEGSTDSFNSNRFGTSIDSTMHDFREIRIGIGFRF